MEARDEDALALNVPSDGGVDSLKALLDRLDRESIAVDGLSVHTPDLDDVFFALTASVPAARAADALSTKDDSR
jgi:ABC-2 type transport system ATP-binding protein